ncbi:autotransporter outer membrane beta-barrel domain-containing protein, partial [Campylobacter sp. Cr9]|uniref:autotransporter outer membrane beta-barrel domain-containing protein n=1 Tax=Campylobacter sp. Cr9 TaxID=2735728 RepID=UPI003014BEC4|nr:autotransporter outer membrane beta-barrel domain-containing protein [Campylobacter sp. Cr9]
GNLTLETDKNVAIIEGGSQITGDIENHGEIYVNNGTISSVITGTGDLFTNQVTYEKDVSLSDIRNSSNATYKGDTKVSNNAEVDNSTFNGMLNVDNKLTAYQGNKFNIVNANSADFLYNANKGASKDITANDINVTTGLVIDNINVTSNKISANTATIKNSANVSSLLTGASDAAAKVYDANITKGNTYNVDNSTIKGGIRADKLNTSKSSIHGQVATNTLNATNTTFYIYGNGFGEDDSLYKGYSGAIIAREGAIGGGNRIQLANTNLSNLTQGFVPVAIIKQSTPTGGVVTAAATSSIGEDFFKVTYKSKLAMYELVDKYKHFSDINGSYVWSVGVSGEDLVNNTNIDNVISGTDSTNIANGANNNYNLTSLEVEVGDMFKPTEFDKEAIDTAKFILTSPDYIIRTKNNTLSKRFRALKDYKLGNGFWLDNQMGYAKYEYNAIRYKNMSVGIDKTHEFNNSDLTLGLAASVGRAETKGNLSSDADSKGFGIYALNKFNNNVFIGANAFYHNIASSYEAKMLDVKANKSHNVYEASIESGVRFGDKVYFEPSLKYHLTSYKPTAINQEGLVLKGDSQLKHELGVALEGGFKVPNVFDAYLAVGLSKELNHKPDLIFIDELKIQNKVDGSKGDTSVGINFGVDYKLSPNASFNIDLGSNLYTNSDKELKGNIGFSYKF